MNTLSLKLSRTTLWFLLILAPLPVLFLFIHFILKTQKIHELEEEMHRIHAKAIQSQEANQKENTALHSLKHSDPHYLDKNLETLRFLLPEVKKLETIAEENPEDETMIKRLHFLKEGGNSLLFSEAHIRTNETLRETEEKQQHVIEVNEEDLKKLLCLIEGVTIWPYGPKEGRPQLVITDFKLSKKTLSPNEKIFVISIDLIKRENLEKIR